MKVIDIVLLVILVFGAYKGYQKGLIMELVQFFSLIIAVVLGLKFVELGSQYLKPHIGNAHGFLPYISFFIIFLGVIFMMNWLGQTVKKLADIAFLGWMDSFLGAVISIMKWAFALGIIIWVASYLGIKPNKETIESAHIYPFLLKSATVVMENSEKYFPFIDDIIAYLKSL